MRIGDLFKEKNSIRYRFTRFASLYFALLIVTILMSNGISYFTLGSYNRTLLRSDQLSTYYGHVELMNLGLTNYIFSKEDAEFSEYRKHLAFAHDAVDRIGRLGHPELVFRCTLLQNMLLTYEEEVEKMLKGDESDQQYYDRFQRLAYLIADTYPEYAKRITAVMLSEKEQVLFYWRIQIVLSIIVFIIFLVAALLFTVSSISNITKPIEQLINDIEKIKIGEFDIDANAGGCKEIQILGDAFNEMAVRLQDYIIQIKEKNAIEKRLIEQENENLRISQLLTETKLNDLQRQMNPHFLFNTLSTISKLAYIEGARKTEELMIRTSDLLRYSIDMSTKISNLEMEIKSLSDYIVIQQRRVGDRIRFELNVEGDFSDVPIPGMVLQPILENCIVHGVKDMIRDAEIMITIIRQGKKVSITVEDNGAGMDQKLLDLINCADGTIPGSQGIGLQNVRKRLDLFFKSGFRLWVESAIDCGTVVNLEIPGKPPV